MPVKVLLCFQQLELQFNIPESLQKEAKYRIFESAYSLKMSMTQCRESKDPNIMVVCIQTKGNSLLNSVLKLNPITDLKLEMKSSFYTKTDENGDVQELPLRNNGDSFVLQPCGSNCSLSFTICTDLETRVAITHTVFYINSRCLSSY